MHRNRSQRLIEMRETLVKIAGKTLTDVALFTSFQSSSCASDSIAHRRWKVRQPEKQTLRNPPGRRRWCPGPS